MIAVRSQTASHMRDIFPLWQTVVLGKYSTGGAYRKALQCGGCRMDNWVIDILDKPQFTCESQEVSVDLANVPVASLGCQDGASYKDICARAQELGLRLCPAEAGPALRLSYKNQGRCHPLFIAMEPILTSSGRLSIFLLECDSRGRSLDCSYGRAEDYYFARRSFVFLREQL